MTIAVPVLNMGTGVMDTMISSLRKRYTPLLCLLIVLVLYKTRQWHTSYFLNGRHDNQPKRLTQIDNKINCSQKVPCTVWMLWDKEWENAPPMQALCLQSWRNQNPNYNIIPLDLQKAEKYINRSQYYSDNAWKGCSIQAKSDIIRTELLARYGGVWADATAFCNEPLDNWLDVALPPTNFLVYERHDSQVTNKTRPWIASWFIVSTSSSQLLTILKNHVRKEWAQPPYPPTLYGYFWLHRIFAKLVQTDPDVAYEYQKVYPMDADGPHCINYHSNIKQHMYKLKDCKTLRQKLVAEFNGLN